MTDVNNSGLVISGKYTDKTVVVPANTTLGKGTILGELVASGKLAQFKSANTDGSEIPVYVLVEDITNSTGNAVDKSNVRVLRTGEMAASKLVFDGTDALTTVVETIVVPAVGETPAVKKKLGTVDTLLRNAGILVYNIPIIVS